MKLIVYGTLRKGGWNHHRLGPQAHFLRNDSFQGKLFWNAPGGVPFAKTGDGPELVHGEVYEVPWTVIPGLDALEGHPKWYQRTHVLLTESNSEAVAYIYQGSVEGMQEVPGGRYPIKHPIQTEA